MARDHGSVALKGTPLNKHPKLDRVWQRFRLTPAEKRVVAFVAAAFLLGLITKCYRDAHPSPTPVQTHSTTATSTSRKAYKTRAKPNDPTRRPTKSEEKLDLSDSATKQDYR